MTDPAAPGAYPAPGQGQTPGPYPAPAQPPAPGQPAGSAPLPVPPADAASGAVPAPPYGAPPPAAAPPPKKKSNALKIVLAVVGVLVVLCGVGIFALARLVSSALDFSAGNCVNVMPTSEVAVEVTPIAVSCDSAEAQAKIIAVHEGKTLDEADTLCATDPSYIAALQLSRGSSVTLLCLAEN